MNSLWYDRQGTPITMEQYRQLRGAPLYGHVATTRLDEVEVETFWLGVDHNLDGAGPPLIFETRIMPGSRCFKRTGDLQAALAAHADAVDTVRVTGLRRASG